MSCLEPGGMTWASLLAAEGVRDGNGPGRRSWQKPVWYGSILTSFSGLSKTNLGRFHFSWKGAVVDRQERNALVKFAILWLKAQGTGWEKFALPSLETNNLSATNMGGRLRVGRRLNTIQIAS